jgi:uncharacterized protein YneF (UPF0154 family)
MFVLMGLFLGFVTGLMVGGIIGLFIMAEHLSKTLTDEQKRQLQEWLHS